MGRVTDQERREVARRLRELDYADLQESLICAYLDALGIEGYADWVGIAHRLADLIDPDHVGDSNKMVDRDALLALAGEFESGARVARARKWNEPANAAMAIALADEYEANARRIRGALGVES